MGACDYAVMAVHYAVMGGAVHYAVMGGAAVQRCGAAVQRCGAAVDYDVVKNLPNVLHVCNLHVRFSFT